MLPNSDSGTNTEATEKELVDKLSLSAVNIMADREEILVEVDEKTPSADFKSHFVVRRSSEKSLIIKAEENENDDNKDDTPPGELESSLNASAPLPSWKGATGIPVGSKDKLGLAPFPMFGRVSENNGMANTRPSSNAFNIHPFMAPSPRGGFEMQSPRMKFLSVPESPMDNSHQPVSAFCLRGAKPTALENSEHSSDLKYTSSSAAYASILEICSQRSPVPIHVIFSGLRDLEKIGEGVFGEVYSGTFRYFSQLSWVYKVVPIEGKAVVNGERQRTFEEIMPEIRISQELSKLRQGLNNCYTDGFVLLRNARVAKGEYPRELVKSWERYNDKYESDNDKPDFPPEQLYMILEFEFAGNDIESFKFEDARQTLTVVLQVAHILAVGESALEFEHRDLHWGNILTEACSTTYKVPYRINGQTFSVPALGVKIVVIDFTISRLLGDNGNAIFLDLQEDEEQFLGTGDHQFDIYRMMRDLNRNNWEGFCPKTNIFWLHYLADKLFTTGDYSNEKGPYHNKASRKLRHFSTLICEYESATHFVQSPLCESYKTFLQTSLDPSPNPFAFESNNY